MNLKKSLIYKKLRDFAESNDVGFLAVYGSYYNNTETENSDLGLIIESKNIKNYEILENYRNRLKQSLNKEVDLITPRQMISSLLIGHVWRLKEYEVLYE